MSELVASLNSNPVTLCFASKAVEGEYLGEVAKRRWPVLIFIFCFDVACFSLRMGAKVLAVSAAAEHTPALRPLTGVVAEMGHQLANMAMLYVLIGLLNKRARKSGDNAARQEEVLLSVCMALAICNLLASLKAENAQDYVYLAFFLICTSTFLKIRWWVGTGLLAAPTLVVQAWHGGRDLQILPPDALVHIVVAWAVGGLMAYLAEWYRRQMFANQKLAELAHAQEMREAQARIQAQRELAAAQAQGAQRALSIAREKAANEAKSEFMSLMCHEVRTPLNGCLASAEMLLDTPLAEEQRELAKTIRVSGSILLSTVSNFLDFFKMEAGKRLDIVRSEVALEQLVADVHCIIEAMVGWGNSVKLRQPLLEGIPQVVLADPDRLRGILLNLYTNAAKFTKRGHIGLRVRAVPEGFTPEPPVGYAGITLTPSYEPHQLTSSHRPSEDMSAAPLPSMPSTPQQARSYAAVPQPPEPGAAPSAAADALVHVQSGQLAGKPAAGEAGAAEEGDADKAGSGASGAADIAADARSSLGSVSRSSLQGGPQPLWLLFEVEDTGIGIGSEGLASLFKEFVQGTDDEMAKPRAKGGTGLGLSICSKQVGVLGGCIGAHSAPGRGSCFWFRIPVVIPAATSRRASSGSGGLAADTPTHGAGAGGQRVSSSGRSRSSSGESTGGTRGANVTFVPAASRRAVPLHLQSGIYSTGNTRFSMEQAAAAAEAAHEAAEKDAEEAAAAAAAAAGASQQAQPSGKAAAPAAGSGAAAGAALAAQAGGSDASAASGSGRAASPLPAGAASPAAGSSNAAPPPGQPGAASPRSAATPASSQPPAASSSGSASRQEGPPASGRQAAASNGSVHSGLGGLTSISETGPATALPPPLPPQLRSPAGGSSGNSSGAATPPSGPATGGPGPGAIPASTRLSLDGRSGQQLDVRRLANKRVLLAEDNLINQTVARKMLASLGMVVEVAANGLEALRAVERSCGGVASTLDGYSSDGSNSARTSTDSNVGVVAAVNGAASAGSSPPSPSQGAAPFSVILMDMGMPVMGGVEATRRIREAGIALPVLAMTANASERDRQECLQAGMDGFLSKPVLKDQLAAAILAVVRD